MTRAIRAMRGATRAIGCGLVAVAALAGCSAGEQTDTGTPFTTAPATATMPMTTVGSTTAPATDGMSSTDSSGGGSDSDGATDPTTTTATGTTAITDPSTLTDPSTVSNATTAPDPVCGNGMIEDGEECDDGNMVETDACRNACVAARCGDGVIQMGAEGCDDGNMVDNDACSNACKAGACGDGAVQMGEACDDGNIVNEDMCLNTCALATCGDSVVQAGVEACDGGGETPQCDGDCTGVACGDGKINASAGEQCDDGNANANDGCSPSCQIEMFAQKCQQGTDPGSGAGWVVCDANANWAWVSGTGMGNYHPVNICQNLGYTTVGQWGGNCNSVCGYCQGGTSCQANGSQQFDFGNWTGTGNCGQDGFGAIICLTVHWTCVK